MGWRDRDYNQYDGGPRGFGSTLRNLVFGSVPLGTWFGIRVRMHASLVILIALTLLVASTRAGIGIQNALTECTLLFVIVLAHEFGHCLAARCVGGHAEEILLWPLGGLASLHTPPRAWPSFVATAGGPLVNVLICALSATALAALTGFQHYLLNPVLPFAGGPDLLTFYPALFSASFHATYYLAWIYSISWMLLIFNLLPIFPLDGGRLVQEILWPWLGYRRSMNFACLTGIIGGIGMMMVGVATWSFLLVFIGMSGAMTCYQMRLMLQSGAYEELGETPDYSSSLRYPTHRKIRKGWFRTAARRAAKEHAEQVRIDAILAKVHDKGLHSLTWWERRALRKATERQRQQDLAERL